MELRDLEYFAAIARHGSLARASEDLGLSPAALSKSVRRLEAAIDAKLMERAPKGMALTGSGKLLLARADKLRLTMEDVKREAAEMGAGRAGKVCIGVNQIDCERIAVACTALLADAPELAFEVTVSTNDVMVPLLRKGELDLVVSLAATAYDDTVREILFDDKMVVCASPSHPYARRRRLTIADVAKQRWVLTTPDASSRQALERTFRERGFPPLKIAVESGSLQVRLAALANSETLGFHSRRLLSQTAASRLSTVELPVEDLVWPFSVGVIYRKDGYLSRAAQRLIELLRSSISWTS